MAKRSKVRLYEQIRRARVEDESVAIRELGRRFKAHRRDVRAALASAVPPARKVAVRPAPKMDAWKPVVDAWLAADRDAPRKQRHTARRVWQRLVAEHDAQIGESTVRRYVAGVRAERALPLAQVNVPQTHVLGAEAEVDFGTISVCLAGVLVEVSLFVMRLSASGRGFCRAYLNEAQEVFLDGHVRGFEHFGGVPGRVRYDNLKAAVVKVLKGRDRLESDRFIALRSHYRFDSFFCIPGIGGAHEKGGVEGEVGRFRRRHLVPVPHVTSMSELNELLAAGMRLDDSRFIAHRRVSVGDHFAVEAPELAGLPDEPFDVAIVGSHRVDTKSRVCVRQCHYSVPARYVRRRLDVRVAAETIEVLDGAAVVAGHRRGRKGDEILDLDHYLEVLAYKPGALLASTPLAAARAAGAFTSAHQQFWDRARRQLGDRDGTKALIELLLAQRTIGPDAISVAIARMLAVGVVDPAVVIVEARRHKHVPHVIAVEIEPMLALFDRPAPTLDRYDELLETR
jgi:transposase